MTNNYLKSMILFSMVGTIQITFMKHEQPVLITNGDTMQIAPSSQSKFKIIEVNDTLRLISPE